MNEELERLPPSQRLAALERNKKRNALISAYEAYQRQEPLSLDTLLKQVQRFAYTKVYHLEHDFRHFGSAETADDWAQDVMIKVWQKLSDGSFKGNGEQFYAYVHKIAFNRAQKAFNKLAEAEQTKVPLTVERHEGGDPDAEMYEDDNPELLKSPATENWIGDGVNEDGEVKYKRGADLDGPRIWSDWLATKASSGSIDIPDTVTGKDRIVVIMIRDGQSYAEIAARLGDTENAIKQRVKNLKQRLAKQREREREHERQRYADRHQPFKIMPPQTVRAAG